MEIEMVSQPNDAIRSVLCATEGSAEVDEEQLVADAQRGSVEAFQKLVSCYESRIFRLAERIVRSREDAEEVMQDAFVQAYKNLPHFRGDSRFYTWLARITINEGLMKKRRQRFNEVSIDDRPEDGFVPNEIEDWGPNPEQRYSQEELHSILETTIARLSPGCRMVFQLREVEGFSTEETAQALSLSPSAVKSRLSRARLQLRKLLNHYFKTGNASERHNRTRVSPIPLSESPVKASRHLILSDVSNRGHQEGGMETGRTNLWHTVKVPVRTNKGSTGGQCSALQIRPLLVMK